MKCFYQILTTKFVSSSLFKVILRRNFRKKGQRDHPPARELRQAGYQNYHPRILDIENSFNFKSFLFSYRFWGTNNKKMSRRFPVIFIFKVGSVPLWQGAKPKLLVTKDFCITSSAIILKNNRHPFFSRLNFQDSRAISLPSGLPRAADRHDVNKIFTRIWRRLIG